MPVPSVCLTGSDLFQSAFDSAAVGMALVAIDGRIVKANPALCRLVGYTEDELLTIGFEVLTHPDDLVAEAGQARRLLAGETESYECEQRYFHKRGDVIWAGLSVTWVRGSDPPTRLAQFQNLTDRKRTEQSLEVSNARLARLLENLHAGILVEDEGRSILVANSAFCRIVELSISPAALVGRAGPSVDSHVAAILADARGYFDDVVERLARRSEIRFERLDLADGRTLERDYVPILAEGDDGAHLWVYRDVTNRVQAEKFNEDQIRRLREANERLAALAATDALTGLPNRRSLHERLFEALEQSTSLVQPVSLVLIDVDRFKDFNDAFGHPAGDEVLRALAGLLRHVSRLGDVPARVGGEEFAILLPETDATGATSLAERCRRVLERAAWPLRPVTASFGVGTVLPEAAEEESAAHVLIAAADAALYRSKAAGRNRVTHADDPFDGDSAAIAEVAARTRSLQQQVM